MEQSSMTVNLPHELLECPSVFMNDLTENLNVHQISTRLFIKFNEDRRL